MSEPTPLPTPAIQPTMLAPPPPARPVWQVVLGLVLALPALGLLVMSYVAPAIWTVRASFHKVDLLRNGGGDLLGGESGTANYESAFDDRLPTAFGFALSLAVVPIIVVLLAAPVLAWAAHLGGTVARWVTRALLALPLAAYAPAVIATALLVQQRRVDPEQAAGLARAAYWWGTFGLFAAVAATLFLAALRRRDPRRSPWPALLVAAAIAVAATVAAALQEFTYPYITTAGRRSPTPVLAMYESAFRTFNFGVGAVYATVLLGVLALLGLAVTVLAVLTRLRLEFDDTRRPAGEPAGWPPARVAGITVAAVVLVVVVILALIGLWPMLSGIFGGSSAELRIDHGAVRSHTWLPTLVSALVGVVVAGLAAFGISWLRPLGRHSEWLLVPFGLFLFVGLGPLVLAGYVDAHDAGRIDSFWGLVPQSWVSVPALFLLALMFRGQSLRAETLHQVGQRLSVARQIVPVLPLAGIAFLATWVVQAQDLLWPLVMAVSPERMSAPVTMLLSVQQYFMRPDAVPYDLVLPVVVFVLLLLLAIAVQLFYLDRVALRVGRPEREEPPRT